MKRILLFGLFGFFAQSAFSQASILNIQNVTNCTVYFKIVGGSGGGGCISGIQSSLITLAPGGTLTYTAGTTNPPGFPPTTATPYNAAIVFSQPTSCTTPPAISTNLGEPCTGRAPTAHIDNFTGTCSMCSPNINIAWTATTTQGGTANLRFQ